MAPQPASCLEADGAKYHDGKQGPGPEQQDPHDDVVRKHGASSSPGASSPARLVRCAGVQ